jgi:hypothetical protein
MRLSSVVGLRPRSSAAPPAPRMRPPVDSSTRRNGWPLSSVRDSKGATVAREGISGNASIPSKGERVGDDKIPTVLGQAPQGRPIHPQRRDETAQRLLDFPIDSLRGEIDKSRRQFGQYGFKSQPVFELGLEVGVGGVHGVRMVRAGDSELSCPERR